MTPDRPDASVRKPHRVHVCILIIVLFAILVIAMAGTSQADDWTIMVYLNGDNDLNDYADDDLGEMGGTNTQDNLIILHDDNTTDQDDTHLYHYRNGIRVEPTPKWLDSEENMGAGSTLEDFVGWCMDEYPSDKTMLIIWDHGGAWKGCSWDDNSGDDNLRVPEIREALNNSLGGEKLDMIYMGACSMSTVEVCYELRDNADYLIGAEKTGWVYGTYGFNLNFRVLFEHMEGNTDVEDICEFIVDESIDIDPVMETQSHIWSAVDLDRMDSIMMDLNSLSDLLYDSFPENYMAIITARENTEEYKSGKRISLWHFCENLQSEASLPSELHTAAGNLMLEIDAAVIANGSWTGTEAPARGPESRRAEIEDLLLKGSGLSYDNGDKDKEESRADHSHGIQIYFPINRSVRYGAYTNETEGVPWFCEDSGWDEFFKLYTRYFFVDDDATGPADGSRGFPFPTIQGAIDEIKNGYVIRVFEGIYQENVEVDKNLTIIGNGTNSVIDAASGNAMTILAGDCRISEFMIYAPTGDDDIEVQAADVILDNLTLTNCGANALHLLHSGDILVEWCDIRMAGENGISIADSEGIRIDNCTVHDNAGNGVGIYVSSHVELSFTSIIDNGEDGIHVSSSSDTVIIDCDINGNTGHGVSETALATNTDARHCYWGDPSGPGKEGPGSGDTISRDVLYSPWLGYPAGTQPVQNHHVDTEGLIQDAVDHAEPGDVILVHEGTYVENVIVDRKVTISGDVELPPYPTVDARNLGTGFYIKADGVRIEKLNITSAFGGNDGIQIGTPSGVIVQDVVISECNFNGSSDNAIELHFTAWNCTIQQCEITDSAKTGILLVDSTDLGATGNTIIDCRIYGNGDDGIAIEEMCQENAITRCEILANPGHGIIDEGKWTSITWSDIRDNGLYGVWFWDAEHSFVRDCDIIGNGAYGVSETTGASYCDGMFNYWGDPSGPGGNGPGHGDGINVNADYSPWLRDPAGTVPQTYIVDEEGDIQDGIDHASPGDTVRVWDGDFYEYLTIDRSISLIGNGTSPLDPPRTRLLTGNNSDAIAITADHVNISGFQITNGINGDNAVDIRGDHATVENCAIVSSGSDAILLRQTNHATISDVRIEQAGGYGIRIAGPFVIMGRGKIPGSSDNLIEHISLSECDEGGILIEAGCHRNTIRNATIMVDGIGIEVRGDHCRIEELYSSMNGDIVVYGNGSFALVITESEIEGSLDTGIYLNSAANWTIEYSVVSHNAEGGVIAMNSPNGFLIDSELWQNSGTGLYLASSDNGAIVNSGFMENEDHGISISSSDNCQISDSEIIENGDDGVHVSISGNVKVTNCAIEGNTDHGVYNPTVAEIVNARWNSWGGTGGPGGEGPGTGDEVSANVLYSPWLGYWAGAQRMPLELGADNSSKVQLALDRSLFGGKVRLSPGQYYEDLNIAKKIDLIGAGSGPRPPQVRGRGVKEGDGGLGSGSQGTVIEGSGKGSVITIGIEGRHVWIRGLLVRGSGPGEYDAGIRILAEGVNIEDVVCEGNTIGLFIENGLGSNASNSMFVKNGCGIRLSRSRSSAIQNCTIAGNDREGIDISGSDRASILKSTIEGNGLGFLVRDETENCSVHQNRIIGNREFGVRVVNNGESIVDATRNFWGKDTGPFHEKRNPRFRKDGPGGNITDLVEFAPWIDEFGHEIMSQDDLDIEDWGDGEGNDEKEWWDIPGFMGTMMSISLGISAVLRRRRMRIMPGKPDQDLAYE
jgi:parallel beta-helix repeat protein